MLRKVLCKHGLLPVASTTARRGQQPCVCCPSEANCGEHTCISKPRQYSTLATGVQDQKGVLPRRVNTKHVIEGTSLPRHASPVLVQRCQANECQRASICSEVFSDAAGLEQSRAPAKSIQTFVIATVIGQAHQEIYTKRQLTLRQFPSSPTRRVSRSFEAWL